MITFWALGEIVIETILIFGAFFTIGLLVRGQILAGGVKNMLIFFAIVALAGALTGAHYAARRVAMMHNQSAMHQR